MRLDEGKLEALRGWGRALERAGDEESAAAGRAILMLIAEIERLQIELRLVHERQAAEEPSGDEALETPAEPFAPSLQERLQRVLRRDSDSLPLSRPQPAEDAGSGAEAEDAATSSQAWIEALRRQR